MAGGISSAVFKSNSMMKFLKAAERRRKNIERGDKRYIGLLSAIVFRDVMDHFADEQGPSNAWEAWSDAYDYHMRDIGKGGNLILQDKGKLRQSFKPTNFRSTSKGAYWFNNAKTKGNFPYAAHHDETAETTRSFMWLSKKAMSDISKQTLGYAIGRFFT